jgi:hypothetical protein
VILWSARTLYLGQLLQQQQQQQQQQRQQIPAKNLNEIPFDVESWYRSFTFFSDLRKTEMTSLNWITDWDAALGVDFTNLITQITNAPDVILWCRLEPSSFTTKLCTTLNVLTARK